MTTIAAITSCATSCSASGRSPIPPLACRSPMSAATDQAASPRRSVSAATSAAASSAAPITTIFAAATATTIAPTEALTAGTALVLLRAGELGVAILLADIALALVLTNK